MDFKQQWNTDMALAIMANEIIDSDTWAEAVEWLLLYGPPEIKEVITEASQMAAHAHFPDLKPTGLSEDGSPLYDVDDLAAALGISSEEAQQRLQEKEKLQKIQHLFANNSEQKIQ